MEARNVETTPDPDPISRQMSIPASRRRAASRSSASSSRKVSSAGAYTSPNRPTCSYRGVGSAGPAIGAHAPTRPDGPEEADGRGGGEPPGAPPEQPMGGRRRLRPAPSAGAVAVGHASTAAVVTWTRRLRGRGGRGRACLSEPWLPVRRVGQLSNVTVFCGPPSAPPNKISTLLVTLRLSAFSGSQRNLMGSHN